MSISYRRMIIGFCGMLVLAGMAASALGQNQATTTASKPMVPTKPADPMAVFKVIPADATAVFAIRNLSELDRDIVGLARQLGFPLGPNGIFPAPLDWLKQNTGLVQGIDDTGSLALVLLNCTDIDMTGAIATKAVLLVPCQDAKAVLEQLKAANPMTQPSQTVAAPESDGLAVVGLMGQPALAAVKDKFLVLGQTPSAVTAFVKAPKSGLLDRMAADRVPAYKRQDLFIWADLHGISPQMRNDVCDMFAGMVIMANPMAAGQAAQSVDQINKFFDESQEVSLGLSLDARGLMLSGYFRMKPGTEMGNQMADTKAPTEPLLIGLKDEPTIFAMGAVATGSKGLTKQQIQQIQQMPIDSFLNEQVLGQPLSPEQIQAFKDGILQIFGSTHKLNLAVANLPAEAAQGLMGVSVVVQVKDSGLWIGEVQKMFALVKELLMQAAKKEELTEDELKNVDNSIQWKAKAQQLAGVSVDQMAVDISQFPGIDEATSAQLTGIIGQEGLLVRFAAVDRQHVVITFGGGPERCGQVAELVKKGEAPLAANASLRTIANRLPEGERLMEGYLNIDQILTLVSTLAMQSGQPMMMPLVMNNSAPLVFAVNRVDDTAQEVHIMVPMELVLGVKQAMGPIMQMMMMGGDMGGGMGGAPQGGMDMDMDEPAPAPVPKPEGQ